MTNNLRWDNAKVKERQAKAIAFKLGGMTLQQIVDAEIGFTSTSGVAESIKRGLNEQVSTNAQEVIQEEIARLDSLIRTWWPKAKDGDPKAALLIVKFQDRRARYLGLDFLDGIAERHVEIQEAQLQILATVLRACFGDSRLNLTEEQAAVVPEVVRSHLNEISAA